MLAGLLGERALGTLEQIVGVDFGPVKAACVLPRGILRRSDDPAGPSLRLGRS